MLHNCIVAECVLFFFFHIKCIYFNLILTQNYHNAFVLMKYIFFPNKEK